MKQPHQVPSRPVLGNPLQRTASDRRLLSQLSLAVSTSSATFAHPASPQNARDRRSELRRILLEALTMLDDDELNVKDLKQPGY